MSEEKKEVKEDLSRMKGAYGEKMIKKLKTMKVAVFGLRGSGIETAKNLLLAGPHTVMVHDDELVQAVDLGANFYLNESDVGKPRGAACEKELADINPNTYFSVHTGEITADLLKQYSTVVFTDLQSQWPMSKLIEFDKICTENGTKFIWSSIFGMHTSIFSNFGKKHEIFDKDGAPERSIVVTSVESGKMVGKITTAGERHLLASGDHIKLEEIQMKATSINATFEIKVHRTNPRTFFIGDISGLGSYVQGGIGSQKKVSVWMDYESLEQQLYAPTIEAGVQNFMKFGVSTMLHTGLVALMQFHEAKKELPAILDKADADKVVQYAKKLAEEKGMGLDEALVTKMAKFARTETNAIAAINGGFVAQEAMKQTGKYTPINQFIHFDAFELVGDGGKGDRKDRYGHYATLFGEEFVEKAHKSNYFLVGCGALGCEFLKNIAMMGLGCKGKINITDDDVIELSNLSRQFLFRRKHVGKLKSESSAGVACEMNPELKGGMNVHKIRVEPKTENVFTNKFWTDLDFVINALDNIHARVYMDGKCILHSKPLFESGTLGTQANSSVHIPHKTPSYAEGAPPGEGQGIAMCTMTNFPYESLHCIEWSRAMFGQMFEDGPAAYEDLRKAGVEKFLEKCEANEGEGLAKLQSALKWAALAKKSSLETCVQLAFDIFIEEYRNKVKDLISCYPKDTKDKNGTPFWRGRKRFPYPQEWDSSNDKYVDFIWHTACIFADVLGVSKDGYPTKAACAEIAAKIDVPEWKAKKVEVEEEGEEKKKPTFSAEDMNLFEKLKEDVSKIDVSSLPAISPGDFEKDDDSNHHIDWITSSANLRADTRKIKNEDRHKCRMIAGRIIAAIATTTASITGFVFLEVYKHLLGMEDINKFNWNTINLATNIIISEMPADPKQKYSWVKKGEREDGGKIVKTEAAIIAVPENFTCYDFIDIKGDMSLGQLAKAITSHEKLQGGLTVTGMFAGKASIYESTDISIYEKKKETALKRLAKAKSAGHKRIFKQHADTAQKFIDAIKAQETKMISETYFKNAGPLADPNQPFFMLDVSLDIDPNLPGWLRSRLPKRDDTHTIDIQTPKVRVWYK
eukprot:jgi/Bigna1/51757/estExt_Genewise1Plus.C_30089